MTTAWNNPNLARALDRLIEKLSRLGDTLLEEYPPKSPRKLARTA